MPPIPVEPVVIEHTRCRVCPERLIPILSLGSLYLSDFPNAAGSHAHPPVPLDLTRCDGCGLVQLAHTTPFHWMYGQYWYRSGVNESMQAELQDVVQAALQRVDLPASATVVDIGANDGTLLAHYPRLGHPKLLRVAWEPARNLYEALRPHASVLFPEAFTVPEPWEPQTKARIVTAIAMFYDLEDPHAFLDGVTKILHPEGLLVIQQAYLLDMLAQTGFDNIVHEHLEYYDLRTLQALLRGHGLEIVDVDLRAINGGSFRVYVQFRGVGRVSDRVDQQLMVERLTADPEGFATFARKTQQVRTQLQATLGAYQHSGGAVDLYAASTKGNTLLQYCGVDGRQIRQAWERSPEKWGRYAGVSAIPIVPEAEGRADPPAALLVTAWQFKQAFLAREETYLRQGGRLIFPLPCVETVEHKEVEAAR